MEKFLKQKKGITLIALVITIIVLLILAGISISMLSGDNSILQKATEAKENTERATIIETAKTDILGQIAENKGNDISKEQLATILNKQFKTVDENIIPDEVSSSNDIELTTIDEKYKINLSEIYIGIINNNNELLVVLSEADIFESESSGNLIAKNSININVYPGETWENWANESNNSEDIITYNNSLKDLIKDGNIQEAQEESGIWLLIGGSVPWNGNTISPALFALIEVDKGSTVQFNDIFNATNCRYVKPTDTIDSESDYYFMCFFGG